MDSGYWKILVHHYSRPKLSLFGFNDNQNWENIPMGDHNVPPVFIAIVEIIQDYLKEESDKRVILAQGWK